MFSALVSSSSGRMRILFNCSSFWKLKYTLRLSGMGAVRSSGDSISSRPRLPRSMSRLGVSLFTEKRGGVNFWVELMGRLWTEAWFELGGTVSLFELWRKGET